MNQLDTVKAGCLAERNGDNTVPTKHVISPEELVILWWEIQFQKHFVFDVSWDMASHTPQMVRSGKLVVVYFSCHSWCTARTLEKVIDWLREVRCFLDQKARDLWWKLIVSYQFSLRPVVWIPYIGPWNFGQQANISHILLKFTWWAVPESSNKMVIVHQKSAIPIISFPTIFFFGYRSTIMIMPHAHVLLFNSCQINRLNTFSSAGFGYPDYITEFVGWIPILLVQKHPLWNIMNIFHPFCVKPHITLLVLRSWK